MRAMSMDKDARERRTRMTTRRTSKSPVPTDIQLFLFPLTSVYVPRSLLAWIKYSVH